MEKDIVVKFCELCRQGGHSGNSAHGEGTVADFALLCMLSAHTTWCRTVATKVGMISCRGREFFSGTSTTPIHGEGSCESPYWDRFVIVWDCW